MRDYIGIGSSPADEFCAQLGTDNYRERARLECATYIAQIRRQFGPEPLGARLAVKWVPHDFGSYAEVVCWFDDSYPASSNYAFKLESEGPTFWDDESKVALGL